MITVHALGDSLVTAYGNDEENFIGGWGDHLWSFFDQEQVQVKVYAQGGRSSRSFLNEGRFVDYGIFSTEEWPFGMGPACNHIKPGDYVLMQFCHNDDNSKDHTTYVDRLTPLGIPDEQGIYPTIVPTEDMKVSTAQLPEEFVGLLEAEGQPVEIIEACIKKYQDILPTYGEKYWPYNCEATYKGYLKFYIDKIRELGAHPVIVTGAARQYFEQDKIIAVPGHHGNTDAFGDFPYIRAARQLAAEEQVPVLDLFARSCTLFEMMGEEDAAKLNSIVGMEGTTLGEARYNRPAKWVADYDKYWETGNFLRLDNTHQNRLGSYLFAGFLADCIFEEVPELGKYLCGVSQKEVLCPAKIKSRMDDMKSLYRHIRLNII